MFQDVKKVSPLQQETLGLPARPSRLISELLDADHDAWKVSRNEARFTFYREIGGGARDLPLGSVVLVTEPGKPVAFDFYCARGRRSLLEAYAPEASHLAQHLIDRERVISLFTKLAYYLDAPSWDHNLSFCGASVTERRVQLRSNASVYPKLVGDAKDRVFGGNREWSCAQADRNVQGIVVSEHSSMAPVVSCGLIYPRSISMTFASCRLREGLHAITRQMVSLVVHHNQSLERMWEREGWG